MLQFIEHRLDLRHVLFAREIFVPPEILRTCLDPVHQKVNREIKNRAGECEAWFDEHDDQKSEQSMDPCVRGEWQEEAPVRSELLEHIRALKRVVCDEMLFLVDHE